MRSHPFCIKPERSLEDARCPDHDCGFARNDGPHGVYWTCEIGHMGCEWRVTHSSTDGKFRVSDQHTRTARMLTHAHFDKLWKQHGIPRRKCYKLLRKETGLDERQCHMTHLNVAGLRAVYAATTRIMSRRGLLKHQRSNDEQQSRKRTSGEAGDGGHGEGNRCGG